VTDLERVIDRRAFVLGLAAVFAGAVGVEAQPSGKPAGNRTMLSVLTEEDLRAEPFQCDCEFYQGSNAIGNTVFATRRHRSVAFVKIDGAVTRLAPVHVSDLGCEKARTYREEWRARGALVKLQFRAAGTGEEACWYHGRLTVEAENGSQTLSVSGSCGC
jgi:hypothetical protein